MTRSQKCCLKHCIYDNACERPTTATGWIWTYECMMGWPCCKMVDNDYFIVIIIACHNIILFEINLTMGLEWCSRAWCCYCCIVVIIIIASPRYRGPDNNLHSKRFMFVSLKNYKKFKTPLALLCTATVWLNGSIWASTLISVMIVGRRTTSHEFMSRWLLHVVCVYKVFKSLNWWHNAADFTALNNRTPAEFLHKLDINDVDDDHNDVEW